MVVEIRHRKAADKKHSLTAENAEFHLIQVDVGLTLRNLITTPTGGCQKHTRLHASGLWRSNVRSTAHIRKISKFAKNDERNITGMIIIFIRLRSMDKKVIIRK